MGGMDIEDMVSQIESMGFIRTWAVYALKVNGNDIDAAVSFIFDNTDSMEELITNASPTPTTTISLPVPPPTAPQNLDTLPIPSAQAYPELPLPPSLPPLPPLPVQHQNMISHEVNQEDGVFWRCGACTFMNTTADSDSICVVCEATRGANFSAAQSMGRAAAEPEEEVLSREKNISVEQAREILKEREEADLKFAQQMAEPKVECIACMEMFPISECFTVDCDQAHRFCFECMRQQTKIALDEKKIAKCMMCSHELSQVEIKQLFGENSSELSAHLDTEIGSMMASEPDLYIGCPTPDCKEYIIANTPGVCERCTCPRCSKSFCSKCKELFHGIPAVSQEAAAERPGIQSSCGLSCGDAVETFKRWNQWRAHERDAFLHKAKLEGIEQKKKMDAATQEALTRFSELQQDETWKEANCRACPHCGKTVYKVDGCDAMTCGRDASDKGGGNKQDGCGQAFRWSKASPYVRSAGDRANLPKSIKDVDPNAAGEVVHHLTLVHQTSDPHEELTISCDVCRKSIVGPRFSCINCFPGLECCIACSDTYSCSTHDPNTHAFQIFFEDMGAAPGASTPSFSSGGGSSPRAPSWYEGIAQFEQARRQASQGPQESGTTGCMQS